jgi:hypothetical protein
LGSSNINNTNNTNSGYISFKLQSSSSSSSQKENWTRVFVVIRGSRIYFYKDKSSATSGSGNGNGGDNVGSFTGAVTASGNNMSVGGIGGSSSGGSLVGGGGAGGGGNASGQVRRPMDVRGCQLVLQMEEFPYKISIDATDGGKKSLEFQCDTPSEAISWVNLFKQAVI